MAREEGARDVKEGDGNRRKGRGDETVRQRRKGTLEKKRDR